ncbi:MAG TPA: hypothetical protein VIY47_04380, partial [Ignavibacteriaceae bacterium]
VDDEEISFVSFAESEGILNESNSAGVAVQLNFSKPIDESGQILISSDWVSNLSRLITVPGFSCDYYCSYGCGWSCNNPIIAINPGTTGTVFSVFPIENDIRESHLHADFYVTVSTVSNNGCFKVTPNSKFALTLLDDDD